jgi:hypothetical protein
MTTYLVCWFELLVGFALGFIVGKRFERRLALRAIRKHRHELGNLPFDELDAKKESKSHVDRTV